MKPEFEETGETLIGVAVAFCSRRLRENNQIIAIAIA
ncbi:hypothetical protein N9414_05439 [Nodularia spumigena CCY9414]|jgi:hypothetical protein|nr:hypothetical protein N9414_05439 [Nodularia spumigena CCY9414]